MTKTEKAIRDFCGHRSDWWPSATQVQAMLALAQPKQQAEPVAYYHPRNGFYWAKPTSIFAPTIVDVPPMPLYTSSPQRSWVALEAEEILDLFDVNNVYGSKWIEFARTVENKLKERNT